MAKLICTGITSLDGYTADEDGKFDWGAPDPEVHAFIDDLERPVGTYLYGRRLYEVMAAWETMHVEPDQPHILDFANLWRAAEKVVYSTTLASVSTPRTRIERAFDPEAVRALKAAADSDLSVGGPVLAAQAFRAGLVDEIRMFVSPITVGGGNRFLPDGVRLDLELAEERRFAGGVVFLRYRVTH